MTTTRQRSIAIYTVAALILSIPLVAMQFTNEVNWSAFDFAVAGILLFVSAFGINVILNSVRINSMRFLCVALLVITLILIWAELAVGIFNSPWAGN